MLYLVSAVFLAKEIPEMASSNAAIRTFSTRMLHQFHEGYIENCSPGFSGLSMDSAFLVLQVILFGLHSSNPNSSLQISHGWILG